MSKVIRVKYEKGVLKPLGMIEELRDGDVIVVKILGKDIAEEVFGSIKVDKERVEEVLRKAEDELGMY